MALTVQFKITRSADYKSVAVMDNATAWGANGAMAKTDVTTIKLVVFGSDANMPLKEVTFTADEKTAFLAGQAVTLNFSDSRLFSPSNYAPDNFYNCQLVVSGGETVTTQVSFASDFFIKQVVMDRITSVDVPISSYYEANRKIVGDVVALLELEYLGTITSSARENKYRKVMSFLTWNHNVV